MALATARPSFSFHGPSALPPPKPFKTQSHALLPNQTPTFTSTSHSLYKFPIRRHPVSLSSIDVSKEDTPISDDPPSPEGSPVTTEKEKLERRRLEERFAVLNTGIYECRSCGYLYNEAFGDPSYPIPPGFLYEKLPENWRCPTCGAAKSFFENKSVEVAGFAENQNFGFGTNTLTGGQKALLIYGSLLLAFALFLSGYFLQ